MKQQAPPTEAEIKERLVKELSISHLTPEEQTTIIMEMSTVLLDRISMALIAELPQEDISRIDNLLEAGQTMAVQATLTKLVPDAASIAEEIIAETMGEYQSKLQRLASEQ